MILLDDGELKEWLVQRSFSMTARKIELVPNTREFVVIESPVLAEAQMFLCGDLLSLGGYDEGHTDMIWISLWDIWNDWNRDLGQEIVCRLRGGGPDYQCLEAASAHLLPFTDRKLAVSILWQVLLFRWDGFLVPSDRMLVECSHDGLIWITCQDHETQTTVLKALAGWEPLVRPFSEA